LLYVSLKIEITSTVFLVGGVGALTLGAPIKNDSLYVLVVVPFCAVTATVASPGIEFACVITLVADSSVVVANVI